MSCAFILEPKATMLSFNVSWPRQFICKSVRTQPQANQPSAWHSRGCHSFPCPQFLPQMARNIAAASYRTRILQHPGHRLQPLRQPPAILRQLCRQCSRSQLLSRGRTPVTNQRWTAQGQPHRHCNRHRTCSCPCEWPRTRYQRALKSWVERWGTRGARGGWDNPLHPLVVPPGTSWEPAIHVLHEVVYVVTQE